MARTTAEAVKALFEEQPTIVLTPFIAAASTLTDRVCATAVDSEGEAYYTDAELEQIELWLAAHFTQVAVGEVEQDKAGPASRTYRGKSDLGLNLTRYGQQAMILDTNGGLAQLNAQRRIAPVATMTWMGTEE